MPTDSTPRKTLDRELGLLAIMAISMGAMLGSGIFVLPGVAVDSSKGFAGAAMPLAYLLSALIVLPAALCKAELATALPRSGGTYLYVERGLGPLAGTVVGLGVWFSLVFKAAFALVGLGAYFVLAFRIGSGNPIYMKLLSGGICLGLAILNMLGAKKSSKVQNVVVTTALLGLAAFTILAAPKVEFSRFSAALIGPAGEEVLDYWSIFKTAGLVFVSFAGVTKICSIAEEVEDPDRNLPRGILLSLLVVGLIYVVVTVVMVGAVPDASAQPIGDHFPPTGGGFAKSATPLATAAGLSLGRMAGIAIAALAVLTLTSMANSGMMTSSRFPLAMARDRLLPSFLSRINSRFRTPVWSILLTASLMGCLAVFVDVVSLAKLASAFQLLVFAVVNLSVIVMRESGARWYKPRYSIPLYPWVPILGFIGCLSLIGFLGPIAHIGAAGIVGFGIFWYFAYARHRVDRKGAVTRLYGDRRRISTRMSGVQRRVKNPGVIIPIFERDEDIEDLIPLAGMLADPGARLKVLRIEEIPDQTALADMEETDELTLTIAQRVEGLAKQHGLDCGFEDVVTHHAEHVLYERAIIRGSTWIVMRWQPRSKWRWFVPDPVAWFIHHPPTHLALFKETPAGDGAGLERFKKILVFAEPGPNDTMVAHIADRFSLAYGCSLTFAHLIPTDDEDSLERVASYHHGLKRLCSTNIGDPLHVRGEEDLATLVSAAADYDLLILGAPPESEVRGAFRGSFEDRVTEQAPCAVLRVKAVSGSLHDAQTRQVKPYNVEDETGRMRLPRDPGFRIGGLIDNLEVMQGSTIRTKAQLFKVFAQAFAERHEETAAKDIEDALWEREKKQVTALGEGVAVPHVALDALDRTYVEVWVVDRSIPFLGVDGAEVDVIFFVLGPFGDRRVHLRTLARIGHLVLLPEFLNLVRECHDEEDLREIIATHEDELEP